ncbi:hypothetical protein GQ607_000565 [Colletotrichum asianum]|uniref:Uncharacterized protein n=1 Tax=Colletotrichum asianum TaxID=702518 RepID=A0A8H3WRS9_9PEZI|nr:hypothetical protein GQ607_000565 [Colletotrichum asianum]
MNCVACLLCPDLWLLVRSLEPSRIPTHTATDSNTHKVPLLSGRRIPTPGCLTKLVPILPFLYLRPSVPSRRYLPIRILTTWTMPPSETSQQHRHHQHSASPLRRYQHYLPLQFSTSKAMTKHFYSAGSISPDQPPKRQTREAWPNTSDGPIFPAGIPHQPWRCRGSVTLPSSRRPVTTAGIWNHREETFAPSPIFCSISRRQVLGLSKRKPSGLGEAELRSSPDPPVPYSRSICHLFRIASDSVIPNCLFRNTSELNDRYTDRRRHSTTSFVRQGD